jgi:hypothetical protein
MPPGTYSTQTLMGVVGSLQQPALFVRNAGFSSVVTFDTEEVFFDKIADDLRIAPFVAPVMAGRVIEAMQSRAEFIQPAYIKPKFPIRPGEFLKRRAGEPISGSLSPQQRKDAKLAELLQTSETMRARREELMAVELLRSGQVTIAGDGYGTRVVDFQRDASLTVTLSGGALWSGTGNPLGDFEAWSLLAQNAEGGAPLTDYVLDPASWTLGKARIIARGDDKIINQDFRGNTSSANLGPLSGKANLVATFNNFRIWVYQDWYKNDAGTVVPYMTANQVLGFGPFGGVRAYGAILDFESLIAQEVYYKTIREDDPSVEYLLGQSAPILIPTRVNATFRATVA